MRSMVARLKSCGKSARFRLATAVCENPVWCKLGGSEYHISCSLDVHGSQRIDKWLQKQNPAYRIVRQKNKSKNEN